MTRTKKTPTSDTLQETLQETLQTTILTTLEDTTTDEETPFLDLSSTDNEGLNLLMDSMEERESIGKDSTSTPESDWEPIPTFPSFSPSKIQTRIDGPLYMISITGRTHGRTRFLQQDGYLTPWKIQGMKFRTIEEGEKFLSTFNNPYRGTIIPYSEGYHETREFGIWINREKLKKIS